MLLQLKAAGRVFNLGKIAFRSSKSFRRIPFQSFRLRFIQSQSRRKRSFSNKSVGLYHGVTCGYLPIFLSCNFFIKMILYINLYPLPSHLPNAKPKLGKFLPRRPQSHSKMHLPSFQNQFS